LQLYFAFVFSVKNRVILGTSSLICQGTSTRRQRNDFFGLRVKLPPVTTNRTTQSRGNPAKCPAQGHSKRNCQLDSFFTLSMYCWTSSREAMKPNILVWLYERIKLRSTDYEVDTRITRPRAGESKAVKSGKRYKSSFKIKTQYIKKLIDG